MVLQRFLPGPCQLRAWLWALVLLGSLAGAWAGPTQPHSVDMSVRASIWLDPSGAATVAEARAASQRGQTRPYQPGESHALGHGALWFRLDLPALDRGHRWFLQVEFNALDHVEFHPPSNTGAGVLEAGDRLPLSRWAVADRIPVFELAPDAASQPVWLRVTNRPVPVGPRLLVLNEAELQAQRLTTSVMLGAYMGIGLLVLVLGLMSANLYRDRAFALYAAYVGCMLGLQLAYTGLGGLMIWPESAGWNNLAPSVFTAWSCATSVWFVREVVSVRRHSRPLARLLMGWGAFGVVLPVAYASLQNVPVLWILHGYMVISLLLAMGICLWAWRCGEKYALWVMAGFLPVIAMLPFPALRNIGMFPASFLTQYSLLIGSAVEIPLLLYVMHRRARELNENRARLGALESTDPLTGLVAEHVFDFRLRDAMRRAGRYGFPCGVMMVELANHGDIGRSAGAQAADRALVRAAAQLVQLARDIDTVVRLGPARFGLLLEGPQSTHRLGALATRILARGLMVERQAGRASPVLSYRVVTLLAPDLSADWVDDPALCLACLAVEMDRIAAPGLRPIRHLSP